MNILHYSLGFPPYRSGGMTKYCIDIAQAEKAAGHRVILLWPGTWISNSLKCKIKKNSIDKATGLENYSIINGLPVPLLDGITEVDQFISERNTQDFQKLLIKEHIVTIHLHTLMGFPIEFLKVAKNLKVSIIYTTHDYFGICPRTSLMKGNECCTSDHNCIDCIKCCKNSLSTNQIRLLQSTLYKNIKNTSFISFLRKKHIVHINDEDNYNSNDNLSIDKFETAEDYKKLRRYYQSMFLYIDVVHFNSKNTKQVFDRYFIYNASEVITITNSNVADNRSLHSANKVIKFAFLSSTSRRKGFYLLTSILEELYTEGYKNFILNVYSPYEFEKPFINSHKPYCIEDISSVMQENDMLLVPSIWNETFGFTVLEAISYGLPVLVTDKVGAKDLIKDGKSGIICDSTRDCIKKSLKKIIEEPKKINLMSDYICKHVTIKTMEEHENELVQLYEKAKSRKK